MNRVCCVIINKKTNKVLLGTKKRGFGKGKIQLPAGKVNHEEVNTKAVIREVKEETGLKITSPKYCGTLKYKFDGRDDFNLYVYKTEKFSKKIKESEEFCPQWIDKDNIPYEKCFPDTEYWLENVLKGRGVECEFEYKGEKLKVEKYSFFINV